jgi:hypothetical protein
VSAVLPELMPPVPPPPIPWWPPAPGWWILGALLLTLALLTPWLLRRLVRQRSQRGRAEALLQRVPSAMSDREWLTELNRLLKRVVKHRGNLPATRLHGDAWLDYLCATYPRPQRSALEPLAAGLYQPAPTLGSDQRQALLRELRRWMRHNHV